jgi:hypothetical protein
VIFLIAINFSCSKSEPNSEIVNFADKENIILDLYNQIIIIPVEGCRQCILDLKSSNNFEYKGSTLFVLTGSTTNNLKSINNFFNEDTNIVIDKNNIFRKTEIVSTTPVRFEKVNDIYIKQE